MTLAAQRTIEQLADAVIESIKLDAKFGVSPAEFDLLIRHPKEWKLALMDRLPVEHHHRHVEVVVI